jgi:hypothetical protein
LWFATFVAEAGIVREESAAGTARLHTFSVIFGENEFFEMACETAFFSGLLKWLLRVPFTKYAEA